MGNLFKIPALFDRLLSSSNHLSVKRMGRKTFPQWIHRQRGVSRVHRESACSPKPRSIAQMLIWNGGKFLSWSLVSDAPTLIWTRYCASDCPQEAIRYKPHVWPLANACSPHCQLKSDTLALNLVSFPRLVESLRDFKFGIWTTRQSLKCCNHMTTCST